MYRTTLTAADGKVHLCPSYAQNDQICMNKSVSTAFCNLVGDMSQAIQDVVCPFHLSWNFAVLCELSTSIFSILDSNLLLLSKILYDCTADPPVFSWRSHDICTLSAVTVSILGILRNGPDSRRQCCNCICHLIAICTEAFIVNRRYFKFVVAPPTSSFTNEHVSIVLVEIFDILYSVFPILLDIL